MGRGDGDVRTIRIRTRRIRTPTTRPWTPRLGSRTCLVYICV